MTREDLVEVLAEKTGILKRQARDVLVALPEIIRNGIESHGKVKIYDLGTFSLVRRAARQGRNPQDGSPIAIPARASLKFTPSKGNRNL